MSWFSAEEDCDTTESVVAFAHDNKYVVIVAAHPYGMYWAREFETPTSAASECLEAGLVNRLAAIDMKAELNKVATFTVRDVTIDRERIEKVGFKLLS